MLEIGTMTLNQIYTLCGGTGGGFTILGGYFLYKKYKGNGKSNGKCAGHEALHDKVTAISTRQEASEKSFDKLELKVDDINDKMVKVTTVLDRIDSKLQHRKSDTKPITERREI